MFVEHYENILCILVQKSIYQNKAAKMSLENVMMQMTLGLSKSWPVVTLR